MGWRETMEGLDRTSVKGVLLALLMMVIMSGALPFLSYFVRSSTWLIWIGLWILIYLFSKELPLGRLLRPLAPYLGWLGFYLTWALIVAPATDLAFAAKIAITTVTLGTAMAVLTARPEHLRTFANVMQWAVVANFFTLFLTLYWPPFANLVQDVFHSAEVYRLGISRFGGLWNNPNMAGYVCLVATILSVLATPWIGWLGRLSCLPLLYLGVSRKAVILYLVILVLYLVLVQGRNLKFWLGALGAAAFLTLALGVGDGLRSTSHLGQENRILSRLMDVRERDTDEKGEETRLGLLQTWMAHLADEPWYGYGLRAMAGAIRDERNPEKVVSRGLFTSGTHNSYLGVWIEVGPVGAILFLLMLLHYARQCLFTRASPIGRWVLLSFLLCNLTILSLSHDHLFCFEGEVAFTLFFLLPSCMGLRALRQESAHPA